MSDEKRNLGIDLVKIISMLLIVLTHCLGHGGVLQSVKPLSIDYNLYTLLSCFTRCCVPCYGMATGFLCYGKKVNVKSIINLWIQVLFYSVFIMVEFCVFDFGFFSIKRLIISCVPLFTEYWYFVAYFGLFIFIPMLNLAIEKMKKKDLLMVIIAIFVFLYTLTSIRNYDMFGINGGTSTIGLISFYIVGAFIKKYGVSFRGEKKAGLYLLLALFFNYMIRISIDFLNVYVCGEVKIPSTYFSAWISPFNMIYSMFLFIFLVSKQYDFGSRVKKIVIALSSATFGVYLIHENVFVRENIISQVFRVTCNTNICVNVCVLLITVIAVYIICSLLEIGRQKLFNLLNIDKCAEKMMQLFGWVIKDVEEYSVGDEYDE